MLIEIIGKNYWKFHGIASPNIGHASILVDGTPTYEGKPTVTDFSFEIADLQGATILTSSLESQSWWRTFLGNGSHVIRTTDGAEVARIIYDGPFGFRRSCVIDGKALTCPRRQHLELPDATITINMGRSARADLSGQTNQLAYLGLAFYLWMREDTMS